MLNSWLLVIKRRAKLVELDAFYLFGFRVNFFFSLFSFSKRNHKQYTQYIHFNVVYPNGSYFTNDSQEEVCGSNDVDKPATLDTEMATTCCVLPSVTSMGTTAE